MSGRNHIIDAQRVLVKLGTQVVTHDGAQLALGRMMSVVEDMARLRHAGRQLVVVSSGAVAMGMRALDIRERPSSLGLTQACAAIGQGELIGLYQQAFGKLGLKTAQVLLSQEDLADRNRALCLRTTLMRLLELGVVPILNENDSVSVHELVEDSAHAFGDNDELSARVATSLNADLLILLTDVDGVYSQNPTTHHDAELFDVLEDIDDSLLEGAQGSSRAGKGGMASKLRAAKLAAESGTPVVIASGHTGNIVHRLFKGEQLGTLVTPAGQRGRRHQRIAITRESRGALVVNGGALKALADDKASLLPIGVVGVEGDFAQGDVVEIRDDSGRLYGRGLVNYGSDECRKLMGQHSSQIDRIIGWRGYDALITRLNLVMGRL